MWGILGLKLSFEQCGGEVGSAIFKMKLEILDISTAFGL